MMHKPLDFDTIEKLRAHMLVSVSDWVNFFGVSRMTYYKWVHSGVSPRRRKSDEVREVVKKLLVIMAEGWPTPEDKGLEPAYRTARLLALLK